PDRVEEHEDRGAEENEGRRDRDEPGESHAVIVLGGDRYSSSSVRAWSHQPSSVRSLGTSRLSSWAPRSIFAVKVGRSTARMSRRPSNPDCMSSWCSTGPNPAKFSICDSSRQLRTSFVEAST